MAGAACEVLAASKRRYVLEPNRCSFHEILLIKGSQLGDNFSWNDIRIYLRKTYYKPGGRRCYCCLGGQAVQSYFAGCCTFVLKHN
jgi:hypothetical protein